MERCDAWRRRSRWYLVKSDFTPDPVLCAQYSAMAQLCEVLAIAYESLFAGDVSIESDVGDILVPLPPFVSIVDRIH